jgi:S-DNA-T family DNA segregation ATPase FtsK/SpoIIIE
MFGTEFFDNSLVITSNAGSYTSVLYYLSSLFAVIAFYLGPWISLPFILLSLLYSFLFVKRNDEKDIGLSFLIILNSFTLFYLFLPSFIGEGLKIISDKVLNIYLVYFTFLASFAGVTYLVFGKNFYVVFARILDRIQKQLFSNLKTLKNTAVENTKLIGANVNPKLDFKVKAKEFLVKKDKTSKDINIDKNLSSEQVITPRITNISPSVDDVNQISDNKTVKEVEVEDTSLNTNFDNEAIVSDEKKHIEKSAKTATNTFFDTKELINYITTNTANENANGPDESYFKLIISTIESKLAEFKLDGKIINILKGPVVDTFELELGAGVKVSKVTGLSDDIGLALNGAPIRIVYPMRGKSTIGIEVPRNPREFIFLDEVLQSNAFNDSTHRLPIAMGKDAFGEVKVVDLAGMPHMLVAGATGAGKSVFINTLLVSLIVKKSPRNLKLVLIDPKQLELALFQDLPHLMLPVITDPKSAAVSLLWAVQEMEQRYTILKELGVKNIEGFNKKIKTCDPSLLLKINEYYEDREDEGYELPYIVVVIDEFADLILSKSGKEIEMNVNRLAAKARAAGIHLVVATQRPSTDVVTGVVKANFPTRVAFKVSTGHDSKTILDQYGAQKLLGKGDMLYKHGVDLLRVHSSFVDESEIEGLIEKLATIPKNYSSQALDFLENGGENLDDDEDIVGSGGYVSGTSSDPMYQQAVEVVIENGSASASMLQRRLRVGYNRAANLVEELERNGIVGPAQGSKPRKVLARGE